MSKKARRRPSWPNKKRRDPIIDRLPYNKYWTISIYDYIFNHLDNEYRGIDGRRMFVSKTQTEIMKKLVFNGT